MTPLPPQPESKPPQPFVAPPPIGGLRSPAALPRRKREPAVVLEPDGDEWQKDQDRKQEAHGKATAKLIASMEKERARKEMMLHRGAPQLKDEIAAAIEGRMNPHEIPTRGNM